MQIRFKHVWSLPNGAAASVRLGGSAEPLSGSLQAAHSSGVRLTDRSFERLDTSPRLSPEVIGVYLAVLDRLPSNQFDSTRVNVTKTLLTAEFVPFPAYLDSCILVGMSGTERAAYDAKQLATKKKLEQDAGRTVETMFKK